MRNVVNPLVLGVLAASLTAVTAWGQEASTTSAEALKIPVFDSIDENSVDLTTGMLRLQSPLLTIGTGDDQVSVGLEWTGRSWRMLGMPTINREDSKYYVTYNGVTEEFNGRSSNFSQREPITGSTLDCAIWSQQNMASNCMYTNRYGDVVVFHGRVSPYTQIATNYGMQTFAMGNLGMRKAEVTSGAHPVRSYGDGTLLTGFDEQHHQNLTYLTFGNQQLKITTPNHNGQDYTEHYLRPDNTTQTITDDSGAVWTYVIDDDREIELYYPPSGLSSVDYTYTGEHRVTSVTNDAGTWTYSYSSSNGYRTITVTTPTGRQYSVKSHIDHGYVVEHREITGPSQRVTTYDYLNRRLWRVVDPELNRIELDYDVRGNVRRRREYPKSGSDVLLWQFGYWQADEWATCNERVLCNRVTSITDPEGNQTDFEFAPSNPNGQAVRPTGASTSEIINVPFGPGKPSVIRHPAPYPGAIRPTVTNTYIGGYLASTSTCMTQASCAGTPDEVKTEYQFAAVSYSLELQSRTNSMPYVTAMTGHIYLPAGIVETAGGVVRRTCNEIDQLGRIVSTTPPNANLQSCPQGTTPVPAYNAVAPESGYAKTAPTFAQ